MPDSSSLVPIIANAAVSVSNNITNLITKSKASGVIQRAQLTNLIQQTEKVLADAVAIHVDDIIQTNLDIIARTQEHIDNLEKQGKLHGVSLNMALDHLGDLNDTLRRNLKRFENNSFR